MLALNLYSFFLEQILLARLPFTELYDYSWIISLVGIAIAVWMKWRKDEHADRIIFNAALVMLFIYSISKSLLYANNQTEIIKGTIIHIGAIISISVIYFIFYRLYFFVRRMEMKSNLKYAWGYFVFVVCILGFSNSVRTFINMVNNIIQNMKA